MKAQGEIIVFILLFIIGLTLLVSATFWSRGIFQQNVDMANVQSSEKFMKDLNSNIFNIIKFGGFKEMRYSMDGTLSLVDNQTIELKIPISIPMPDEWVNISSDSTHYIQEMLDGNMLRIQLKYPESDYRVYLFTEGSRLASPEYVSLERNGTTILGKPTIRIKVTFT